MARLFQTSCNNLQVVSLDHFYTNINIIPWVDSIRYLSIYITRSVKFKCSLSNAKNVSTDQLMLFGKVGRIAS